MTDEPDEALVTESEPEKFDVITSNRQFLLAEVEDGFEVWDRSAMEEARGIFPATAEGFEDAEALFKRLNRERRRTSAYWFRVLLWVFFVALILSVPINALIGFTPWFGYGWVGSIQILFYGAFLGALLVWLRDRPPGSGPIIAPAEGKRTLPRILVAVALGGLAIWVATAVIQMFLPLPEFDAFGNYDPPRANVITSLVHGLSYSIWVSCIASLVLVALYRTLVAQTSDGGSPEDEEDADGLE